MLRGGGVSDAGGTPDDVRLELIGGVLDALGGLRARERAVDAGGGFRAVAAEEGAFIPKEHAAAVLEPGVRRREAGEAASDDDDLLAHLDARVEARGEVRRVKNWARAGARGRGESAAKASSAQHLEKKTRRSVMSGRGQI